MPVSSAVPQSLARFEAAARDGARSVLRAGETAVPVLERAVVTCGGGVGSVAAAGVAIVAAAVPAHARRAASLGETVGLVGSAFAAVGTDGDIAAWIAEQAANGQLDIPEQWPSLVPGVDGCPALAVPIWIRDNDPDGPLTGSLTEPLAAPMQFVCEEEPAEQRQVMTWVLDAGGAVIAVPGTVNEARRRHARPRPDPQPPRERTPAMPPSLSPVWQQAERYQGRVRRDAQGRLLTWDYTHGDIEVFSPNRRHLGSAHPITGEIYKPPVAGRRGPN